MKGALEAAYRHVKREIQNKRCAFLMVFFWVVTVQTDVCTVSILWGQMHSFDGKRRFIIFHDRVGFTRGIPKPSLP